MTLLSVRALDVTIRGQRVVKDVSLDVEAGEIVALTGESGSGKSLTALAIMGLLPDAATVRGQVLLDGEDLTAAEENRLCSLRGNALSMVFQEPMTALNPLMTIGDQVAEPLRLHEELGRAEAARIAAETLVRVGLDMPPGRYPHELSGGQRQRVVIAMAIALRPRLLIADEPTTALDVTTQAQILSLLKGLVSEFGMGLILITHDLAVVAETAVRVAVMQNGRVVETGPVPGIFRTMSHPYTRALFAASGHVVPLRTMERTGALLTVRDVVREYPLPLLRTFGRRRALRAVDGVSLTVAAGERVGLVGESGSGKSTLTRAILGLEPVQAGSITVGGMPMGPDADAATRRRIQVVFQDPYGSFDPRHRVGRLIAEPLHLSTVRMSRDERRAAVGRALSAVGLQADHADRFIHQFSGGQRQRIAIARALIVDPDIIVFDEAVSALDVSVRARILDLMADLSRQRGLAWLFASHDLSVVRSVTDRVLVMKDGRIVEEGPTETVLTAPRNAYTKALIAAAPRLPESGTEGRDEHRI